MMIRHSRLRAIRSTAALKTFLRVSLRESFKFAQRNREDRLAPKHRTPKSLLLMITRIAEAAHLADFSVADLRESPSGY
jgi:hypothetical protein